MYGQTLPRMPVKPKNNFTAEYSEYTQQMDAWRAECERIDDLNCAVQRQARAAAFEAAKSKMVELGASEELTYKQADLTAVAKMLELGATEEMVKISSTTTISEDTKYFVEELELV